MYPMIKRDSKKAAKSQDVRSTKVVLLILGLSVLCLSGCALNPYVSVKAPIKLDGTADTSLSGAMKYANDVQAGYREALGQQAILENSMGGGLITAGAAVLGLAAYGAHTDAILGVGLGAGTGYALGSWYTNKPRQLIYLQGMEGIHCAKTAVLPLDIGEYELTRNTKLFDELSQSMEMVNSKIGEVEQQIPIEGSGAASISPLVQTAKTNVEKAKVILANAAKVRASGDSTIGLVKSAGSRLLNSVDKIIIEVDKGIQASNPALSAIPGIVQGLSDSVGVFAPGLDVVGAFGLGTGSTQQKRGLEPESRDKQDSSDIQLSRAMSELNTASRKLSYDTDRLQAFVKKIQDAKPVEALKACQVSLPEAVTQLSLVPASLTFTEGKAAEKRILVSGGKSPYSVLLLDGTNAGLTVHPLIPGDSVIRVSASEETKAGGPYQMLVMDATRSNKTIVSITIIKTADAGPGGESNKDKKGILVSKTKTEIEKIQRVLCTKDDGIVGENTREAIRKFQTEVDPPASGYLTKEQFDNLNKMKDCKDGAPGYAQP